MSEQPPRDDAPAAPPAADATQPAASATTPDAAPAAPPSPSPSPASSRAPSPAPSPSLAARQRTLVRRATPYALTFALLAALVAGRVLYEGARELSAGESAAARGDVLEAVRRLRRAAHWYLPGSPYTPRAYERLEALAIAAESQGRADHAFAAWRAIRASALATRWLVVPERARLERANRHLAALLAEMPPPPEDRDKDRARLREEHLALLTDDRAPEPAWVLVMGVGFALWLGAAAWAARHGWDEADRVRARALGYAAGVFVLGLALFALALARA